MKLKNILKDNLLLNRFNNYPDGVIVIDRLDNIVCWNDRAHLIFGYNQGEMTGRNIEILFDGQAEKIHESAKTQKPVVLCSKNNQDEEIFVEVSCRLLARRKETLLTVRDVTNNHKVIEKLLVEYEIASKISNNKNKFIVGLSSDLKTPIHSIIGFSQGLLDGVCGDLNEKQSKYISVINRNANGLLDLIDNLLQLSGIEAGNIELNYRVFDIIKTIYQACDRVRAVAEKKGLDFEVDVSDIAKKNVYSDENMVYRVLLNILENAVKFTESGSVHLKALHPDVETAQIHGIKVEEDYNDRSYLMFRVTDTGIGLAMTDMSVIFDEYSQGDRTIARRYGGTGLKLALSKKILASLNGVIWAESEAGQGSTFSFIIPVSKMDL